MAKKNDLKNSMSAGLTGGLDETYHQNLKLIAIRKGDSLKSVLQEAISDYLDKNSSLL